MLNFRWGGDGWTRSLRKAGQQDGLEFKNWKIWPNSLHGHRLIHLAGMQKGPEGKGKAKNHLFCMIYEGGKNISDIDTLIEAAKELGLEGGEDYLKSSSDVELVLSQDSHAKSQMKISGVPFFVISSNNKNNKTVSLSGAQGTEEFLAAFSHVTK